MGFAVGDYRTIEHLDAGYRSVAAPLFRGQHSHSERAVAMTVLSIDQLEVAHAALRTLPDVQHPHLLPVDELVQDETRVALICPWPAAGRLAELLVRRQRLSTPETLTVLIPLASVVARLHAADLRHGDIGPTTIWFDTAGRPMLGAVGVAHVVAAAGDGMPAGIRDVAPEVVRGDQPTGGTVTLAADIFSLGSVALRCLAGRPAWPADDLADVLVQSAAGLWPDLPADAGPPALLALVRAMLRADPAQRPSAREVVSRLEAVGDPEPVAFGPVPAAQSNSRWNGWDATPTATARDDCNPAGSSAQDVPAEIPGTSVTQTGPPAPGRRPKWLQHTVAPLETGTGDGAAPDGPSRLAKAAIAVLVGLLVVVVGVQVGLWWTGRDQPGSPVGTASDAAPAGHDAAHWMQIVADLDLARGRALATADAAALAEVYVARSAPALADAELITELAARGWTIRDGVHEITNVTLDPAAGTQPPAPTAGAGSADPVRLLVADSLPARPIVDTAGKQVGQTPARGPEQRILTLVATSDGYRISAVEPG